MQNPKIENHLKRLLLVSALFGLPALALAAPLAFAQNAPQVGWSGPQRVAAAPFTDPSNVRADLARIDYAMNNTASFSGRFVQTGPDGTVARGRVHLQRPGKLRVEYDAPNPLLIVSDGVTFTQQDRQLETFDRVPLKATPLNYFLKENINLANDTEVVALQKSASDWRVTAKDGSGEVAGAITMVFEAGNLALKEWIISDDFGGQTRVALSDLQYNPRMDPRLFILRDDSNRRDRRRN